MTTRFEAAKAAMQGLLAGHPHQAEAPTPEMIAKAAVIVGDALLAELKRTEPVETSDE